MMRLAAALATLVLVVVPLVTTTMAVVAVGGAIAALVATLGIVTLWRWPVTVAACVFLTDYAVALWVTGASVSVVTAAVFGVALLLLLQSTELARCARRAVVEAAVVRSQLLGWAVFGAATVATAAGAMVCARVVAGAIPLTAAPLVAGAGALGVVLAVAIALTRARAPSAR